MDRGRTKYAVPQQRGPCLNHAEQSARFEAVSLEKRLGMARLGCHSAICTGNSHCQRQVLTFGRTKGL